MLTSDKKNQPIFHHEKGVTYFSKRAERTVFFIMTLAMLCWGIAESIAKWGIGG